MGGIRGDGGTGFTEEGVGAPSRVHAELRASAELTTEQQLRREMKEMSDGIHAMVKDFARRHEKWSKELVWYVDVRLGGGRASEASTHAPLHSPPRPPSLAEFFDGVLCSESGTSVPVDEVYKTPWTAPSSSGRSATLDSQRRRAEAREVLQPAPMQNMETHSVVRAVVDSDASREDVQPVVARNLRGSSVSTDTSLVRTQLPADLGTYRSSLPVASCPLLVQPSATPADLNRSSFSVASCPQLVQSFTPTTPPVSTIQQLATPLMGSRLPSARSSSFDPVAPPESWDSLVASHVLGTAPSSFRIRSMPQPPLSTPRYSLSPSRTTISATPDFGSELYGKICGKENVCAGSNTILSPIGRASCTKPGFESNQSGVCVRVLSDVRIAPHSIASPCRPVSPGPAVSPGLARHISSFLNSPSVPHATLGAAVAPPGCTAIPHVASGCGGPLFGGVNRSASAPAIHHADVASSTQPRQPPPPVHPSCSVSGGQHVIGGGGASSVSPRHISHTSPSPGRRSESGTPSVHRRASNPESLYGCISRI